MKGKVIKYDQDNIDTDVILPGQYLKLHDHAELGEHAMEGMDPNFHSKAKEANIIVTGKNFGCGSSREHAPIAISACGIQAVLALSFARIFIEIRLMALIYCLLKLMKRRIPVFQKKMS